MSRRNILSTVALAALVSLAPTGCIFGVSADSNSDASDAETGDSGPEVDQKSPIETFEESVRNGSWYAVVDQESWDPPKAGALSLLELGAESRASLRFGPVDVDAEWSVASVNTPDGREFRLEIDKLQPRECVSTADYPKWLCQWVRAGVVEPITDHTNTIVLTAGGSASEPGILRGTVGYEENGTVRDEPIAFTTPFGPNDLRSRVLGTWRAEEGGEDRGLRFEVGEDDRMYGTVLNGTSKALEGRGILILTFEETYWGIVDESKGEKLPLVGGQFRTGTNQTDRGHLYRKIDGTLLTLTCESGCD